MIGADRRVCLATALLALALVLGLAGPAVAVDVSDLSDFESNPCVLALADRNKTQHVDAPDSALSDNCDRAHGNVEVAWDFLLRTWQPRDSATYAASYAPPRLTAAGLALALLEILLAYAVLGAPVQAIGLILQPAGVGTVARRAVGEAATALLLRLSVGSLLLAVLALPFATLLAAIAVLIAIAAAIRRRSAAMLVAPGVPAPSAVAVLIAAIVNDLAAAAPGLLALAVIARGSWRLLALAVLLAVIASLPAVRQARLALRRNPPAAILAASLLAAGVLLLAAADPPVARAAGSAAPTLVAIASAAFAGVLAWRGNLLGQRRRPLRGG